MFQPPPVIAPGFTAEDYEDEEDDVLLWPENERAYALFKAVETQWCFVLTGSIHGGIVPLRVGLRYEAVYPMLNRLATTQEEWDELFRDLRIMEAAAVDECAKLAKDKR